MSKHSKRLDAAMHRMALAREEAMLRGLMGRVTSSTTASNIASEQDPLTWDKIARLAADMRRQCGPTPLLLSSKVFPYSKAFTVEDAETKYTCAHPSFWMTFERQVRRDCMPAPLDLANPVLSPLMGMQIVEIDLFGDEDEARRQYLLCIWERLIAAAKVALVELPDWLKAAPKFGELG